MSECEYILKCESECLFVDREESCPLWKHYSTEAKLKDCHRRLDAVGSDKCQINLEERMLRYNSDAIDFVTKKLGL
jgi:hypothetical protein